MSLPKTMKATELTCPYCRHKHTFSGYPEGKNKVSCPECRKIHPIKTKSVARILK
ncbi:hypothetical protein [Williamwhitmania taraxaci]|uniref:Uncharacterized protein n=1 Tax=Williamwhitmania taraxaci TaxID=1640674 RepID=A0A1G6MCD1_9BACT|nr:hypothetical protein [Williamwhitmania taraxaci]SDC53242.1 hypothetical protein SAMN05216323_103538 [Williamwhitmania taraxaci]